MNSNVLNTEYSSSKFSFLIAWASKKNVNRSKKTYCQASLIFGAIVLVIYVVMIAVYGFNLNN